MDIGELLMLPVLGAGEVGPPRHPVLSSASERIANHDRGQKHEERKL